MKKNILFSIVAFACVLSSCNGKDDVFPDLKVSQTEVSVETQESISVEIVSGSGKYQAKSQDETKVKTSLQNNVLHIEGVSHGATSVMVTDTKSHQTVQIKVIVSSDKTMKYVALKVVEFKQTKDGNNMQDISPDKLKEYWGERIADNTPMELQLKKDSLYIVKPNDIVEKYKTEWRGEELFLYNQQWRYCGVKTPDNGFMLNIGFYIVDSKTESRSLLLVGQDYAYKNYSEIGNYPNARIIWTKINVQFNKK